MSKFNVGDKVKVIDQIHGHEHAIGEVITIASIDYGCTEIESLEGWYLQFEEIVPYSEGPIRTVTRREIVAGCYGNIHIDKRGFITMLATNRAENIREAAHTLNQIAEVLEDV